MKIARYLPGSKYFHSDDLTACSIVVFFVMALALVPHLLVSRQVGQVAFFQMGFDEDTYLVYMVSNYFEIGRALSHYIFAAMFALTNHSVDWTMILADAIFPATSAVAAYYLASSILGSWRGRTVLTLLLLFGQDLFSLANVSVWNYTWLVDFRKFFGAGVVPDATTSYLTILRTPEPQLSYALVFALLGLLLRIGKDDRWPGTALAVIAGLGLLLPFTYTYVAFPTLIMAVWVTLVSFFFVRRDLAIRLAAIVLTACAVFAGVSVAKAKGALEIYTTHLPTVTPALLVCGLIVVPLAIWTAARRPAERAAWLAIGFLAIPIIVSNQQVITGLTVGTRDWERNVNYQFLALGAALFSTLPKRTLWMNQIFRWAGPGIALVVALVVSNANRWAMKYWDATNTPSIFATMQAIDAARSTQPDVNRLLVQPAELVPILNVRTNSQYDFVLNLARLYMPGGPCCISRIPAGGVPSISPVESILFEYWWRSGISPEDAQKIVTKEALQQGGYYLGYLYSTQDAYAAASDGKNTRTDEIIRDIPRAIDRYRNFLQSDHAEIRGSRVIVLTEQEPSTFEAQKLKSELVGTGHVGSKTVYAYLQKLAE